MRLTFLYQIHHLARTQYGGDLDIARKDVQRWFTEKFQSPFNTLRSLKHRAAAIVYGTPSMPRSVWTDRKNWTSLLYRGHPVHLDQIRDALSGLEDSTVTQWEDKVLLGLKIRVDYTSIADDLTNTDVGYSFISDPRNTMFHDRDRLTAAILEDPHLRARFTTPTPDGTGVCWSKHAMHEWLLDYGQFNGLQATRTEMLAGAPGRSTELHAMNYCNTPTRTTRSLSMVDKYLQVMRCYTKTGSITGKDKMIPHAVDALTADLMIQDLALARPFAEHAARICYPGREDIVELYKYRLFANVNKEFIGSDMSSVMKSHTWPTVGFGIDINTWRHLHVMITRKLCNRTQELLDESEENTPRIRQYGHTNPVHNGTYGLSHDALAGLPEDFLPDFLDASTDWQVLARVVPGVCNSI